MYTTGIIGFGFVGDALCNGFNDLGVKSIAIYDPFKIPKSKITDVTDRNIVFICVPTPMKKSGDIDITALSDVMNKLSINKYKGIVVIKSTVRPDIITYLSINFKLNLVTNPEFLTERTARKDFLETKWMILGGKLEDVNKVEEFYNLTFKRKISITKTTLEAAMMAKYMTNTFFAVKISLLNEFHQLWTELGNSNWNDLIWAFSQDKRVGLQHLRVPGPDGEYGFGGKCFPKDLNALISLSKKLKTPNETMTGAWETNLKIRKDKDWFRIDGAVVDN